LLRWLNKFARYTRDTANSSFSKFSAVPLPQRLKTTEFICTAQRHEQVFDHGIALCGKEEHCVHPQVRYKRLRTDGDSRLGF